MAPDSVEQIVSTALETTVQTCRRPAVGSLAETYVLQLEEDQRVVCKVGGASVWSGDVIEPDESLTENLGYETYPVEQDVSFSVRVEGSSTGSGAERTVQVFGTG